MKVIPGAVALISVMLVMVFVSGVVAFHNRDFTQALAQTPELDSIVSWMPWLDSLQTDRQKFCTKVVNEDLPNLKKSASIQAGWVSGNVIEERFVVLNTYVVENC